MQSVLRLVYPPQCVMCGAMVAQEFSLCSECWKDTPFIQGAVCDGCGVPLPGEIGRSREFCDDCLKIARPWVCARAATLYRGKTRKLVLAIKHGDRLDLTKPAARWMANTSRQYFPKNALLVPIPVHWTRLLRRRFNQAAVLANEIAALTDQTALPDALVRVRKTKPHDGMTRDDRFANMSGAIRPHPKNGAKLRARSVVLVDDVMTSGATFAAATEACHAAGADQVFVLALARVAKAD